MQTLKIYYNSSFVGDLVYDEMTNSFCVQYNQKWVNVGGFPLSPCIPFENSKKFTAEAKAFVDNLLPEGDGLERLSLYLQVSKNNKYSLLKSIGDETSGAFSFLSSNSEEKTRFREISPKEMGQRIRDKKRIPITIWDDKPRLSVAGIQDKLPIVKSGERYGLGEGDLCSTHILKFDKGDENLILNEWLSLTLARSSGLVVNDFNIVNFDNEYALEVTRFDRELISNKKVVKKHVIDSCQVLGKLTSFKYERNLGSTRDVKNIRLGISFNDLSRIALESKIPILEIQNITRWSIANLCLGNSDAHGKNISFFYDGELKTTPFYDIVNIGLYKDIYDTSLAMAIGDEFNILKISEYDVALHCYTLGIKPKQFIKEFNVISEAILQKIEDSSMRAYISKFDSNFYDLYCDSIVKNIQTISSPIRHSHEVSECLLRSEIENI